MLRNSLCSFGKVLQSDAGTYQVEVALNADHRLFQGHFPTQPILPGVCLLEMVKEILVEIMNKPLSLQQAGTIKYLKLVDPHIDPKLRFEISIVREEGKLLWVNANSFLLDGSPNFKLLKASYA